MDLAKHTEQVPELIPSTAKEALRRWDADESVFTVEVGGLGPGYEQCIHIVVFELIRAFLDDPSRMIQPDGKHFNDDAIGAVIRTIEETKHLGLSGIQINAAQSLAYRYLTEGYAASVNTASKGRHIQVSKHFPS